MAPFGLSSEHLGALLCAATAYAAGRRTYVPSAVADTVVYCWTDLSEADRGFIIDWLAAREDLGDNCDVDAWMRVFACRDRVPVSRVPMLMDWHIVACCAVRAFTGRLSDGDVSSVLVGEAVRALKPVLSDSQFAVVERDLPDVTEARLREILAVAAPGGMA